MGSLSDFLIFLMIAIWIMGPGLHALYGFKAKRLENSLKPNEFIFKKIPLPLALNIITPAIFLGLYWDGWSTIYLMLLILWIAACSLSIVYNRRLLTFGISEISANDNSLKVKTEDITGIRISDHEVTFHTRKYVNHHRFMSEDLMSNNWTDFQEAIREYTSQFDHIKVETV